jgi:hypothetical protein
MRWPDSFSRVLGALASLRIGIPLLALIAAASTLGWLTPQGQNVELPAGAPRWVHGLDSYLPLNDIFHSRWFVLLLALLALNLAAGAIRRVPAAWRQRGRTAGAGVLLVYLGALLVLSGAILNGSEGFRYYTRLVEGEVTVLPHVPFVVRLDRFELAYVAADPPDAGAYQAQSNRQEAVLTLLQNDEVIGQATTPASRSVTADGTGLLPSATDTGWAFTLVIRDPGGREKIVPVKPWAPPLARLGLTRQHVFADRVARIAAAGNDAAPHARPNAAEIFLVEDNGERESLGFATEATPVSASGYLVSVWRIRPYTGLYVYRRPGFPVLVAGLVCLLAGAAISGFVLGAPGRRKARGG